MLLSPKLRLRGEGVSYASLFWQEMKAQLSISWITYWDENSHNFIPAHKDVLQQLHADAFTKGIEQALDVYLISIDNKGDRSINESAFIAEKEMITQSKLHWVIYWRKNKFFCDEHAAELAYATAFSDGGRNALKGFLEID